MFAVGVGRRVSDAELLRIAGDEKRWFKVDNYDRLSEIKQTLAFTTCVCKYDWYFNKNLKKWNMVGSILLAHQMRHILASIIIFHKNSNWMVKVFYTNIEIVFYPVLLGCNFLTLIAFILFFFQWNPSLRPPLFPPPLHLLWLRVSIVMYLPYPLFLYISYSLSVSLSVSVSLSLSLSLNLY